MSCSGCSTVAERHPRYGETEDGRCPMNGKLYVCRAPEAPLHEHVPYQLDSACDWCMLALALAVREHGAHEMLQDNQQDGKLVTFADGLERALRARIADRYVRERLAEPQL